MNKPQSLGKKSLIIEGNIGAGKSTFLQLLNTYLDVHPVIEPHEKWQNIEGENLLDKFYSDTKRWAYTFQSYAFVSRVVEHEKSIATTKKDAIVLERSVYSDRYCFAKNAYEMSLMTSLEWQLYKEWFAWLVHGYTLRPSGFIYLRTDPEVCYSRMQNRNRSEESSVSLEYLKLLHDKHESWLIEKDGVDTEIEKLPVLVLQCNTDFEHNIEEQQKHIKAIVDFFGLEKQLKNMPLYKNDSAKQDSL